MPVVGSSLVAAVGYVYGERGEIEPDGPGSCPCGEPAVFGQYWITEWFDSTGLVTGWVTIRLCAAHRARKNGRTEKH